MQLLNSSISDLLEVRSFLVNLILWVRKKFILAATWKWKAKSYSLPIHSTSDCAAGHMYIHYALPMVRKE